MNLYTNPSTNTNSTDSAVYIIPKKGSFLIVKFTDNQLSSVQELSLEKMNSLKGDFTFLSCSSAFHLLPNFSDGLLDKEKMGELLNWDGDNESFTSSIANLDLSIHFQETEKIKSAINQLIPSISWTHIIEKMLLDSADSDMNILIYSNKLFISVFQNRKLILSNQFDVSSSEEVLYYIMLLFQELRLSQEEMPVNIYGDMEGETNIVELLNNYVRKITAKNHPAINNKNVSGLVALLSNSL